MPKKSEFKVGDTVYFHWLGELCKGKLTHIFSRGGWRVYNEDTDRVYYIEPNRPATYVLYGGNREITVRVYHTEEEANN